MTELGVAHPLPRIKTLRALCHAFNRVRSRRGRFFSTRQWLPRAHGTGVWPFEIFRPLFPRTCVPVETPTAAAS